MKRALLIGLVFGLLTTFCSSLSTSSLDAAWKLYKTVHKKRYDSMRMELYRRSIWEDNVRLIEKHNFEADMGLHTFTMKVNQFADLTSEEFVKQMNQLKMNPDKRPNQKLHIASDQTLPPSVDWRTEGYVTPVKNQEQCGSCWAFSVTGTLEGQIAKITQKLISLSEQQLVDCSTNYGNAGCCGGMMDYSYKYLEDSHGIDTNASYPYEAIDGTCRFNTKTIATDVTGYVDIKAQSEADLQDAIATIGPIAVAIDASHTSFQFYSSGVYSDSACSSTNLDFSLLAVGYGTTTDNQEYYILKNQWSTLWGMDGYVWMARNKSNQCGIATMASYALI